MAPRKTNQADEKPAEKPEAKDAAPADKPEDQGAVPAGEPGAEAQASPPEAQADKGVPQEPTEMLVVKALRPRRRAGRSFGSEPVRIPLSDLSDDEIAAIRADRALSVAVES